MIARLTLLCVWVSGAAFGQAAEPIMLDSLPTRVEPVVKGTAFYIPNPIYQQIARQAVLLTAREEFGLPTRDIVLGEPIARGGGDTFMLELEVRAKRTPIKFTLTRGDATLLQTTIKNRVSPTIGFRNLTADVEPLTHNELHKVFVDLGYEPRPAEWHESAELTGEVESLLWQMNDIAQWRALRMLHAEIRESGESPQRLAGVVRAYANLAALTDCTLDLQYTVYIARSLLYAERLVKKQPKSPYARWTRAYAYLLTGMINLANEEIDAIRERAAEGGVDTPEWCEMLENYGRYRHDEIESIAFDDTDKQHELAMLLWFRIMRQFNSTPLTVTAGQRAIAANPRALWVLDAMFLAAGVGPKHQITGMAPALQSQYVTQCLPHVEDLPDSVAKQFNDEEFHPHPGQMADIAHELVLAAEGDQLEPSLAVLGRGIEAWAVLHVDRRGQFVLSSLASDASDERDYAETVINHHPLAPLVRTWFMPRTSTNEDLQQLYADFHCEWGNIKSVHPCLNVIDERLRMGNETVAEARQRIGALTCDIEGDLTWLGQTYGTSTYVADKFNAASSFAPMRFESLVLNKFDENRENIDKWLESFGHYPSLNRAAAQVFIKRGEYERSIECFERYLAVVPDGAVMRHLAFAYFCNDQPDRSEQTLVRVLECRDFGLEHSYAAATIAANKMHDGEFEAAREWAERGAESGAHAPMEMCVECLTALGEYERAEQMMSFIGRRYNAPYDWYDWCMRTGKGDADAALKMYLQDFSGRTDADPSQVTTIAIMHATMTGEDDEALRLIDERLADGFQNWDILTKALIYDRAGADEKRDECLRTLVDHDWQNDPAGKTLQPSIAEFLLSQKGGTSFSDEDVAAFSDKVRQELDYDYGIQIQFYLAMYLEHHGAKERAIEYYKPAACYSVNHYLRRAAWIRLRGLGVEPAQIKGRKFAMQFYKK